MSRRVRILLVLLLLGGFGVYRYLDQRAAPAGDAAGTTGGRLVATIRSEPTSFNRFVVADAGTLVISALTADTLVRVDRATGALQPRLARAWTTSPDGLTWTLDLRQGVKFSDGAAFTSADVLFTFETLYDTRVHSPMAGGFLVNDKPLVPRATDDHTVVLTFPSAFGPGLSILDGLPILPRHMLHATLKEGTFGKAWGVTAPVNALVGLGPFVITEVVAGSRVRLARNPEFWRHDDQGKPLPYLDGIDLEVVPDQNAEVLRFESGHADLLTDQVRPEDLAAFKNAEAKGALKLVDAGVGADPPLLWFNLTPRAPRARDRPWLQSEALRRAISSGVDRQALANTVYLGAAEPVWGPVTSGAGEWYVPALPRTPFDLNTARAELRSLGLTDRTGDGLLHDAAGKTARFSILTQKGNTMLERGAAVLKEQLAKVGLTADVDALERRAMIGKFAAGDYDAMYFVFYASSTDPALNPDFWLSSGSFHVWHPGQTTPATAWETRIDALMREQATSIDAAARRRLFAQVQTIFAEHLPALYFASPKVTVAMSARVAGAQPVVRQPQVLWNAEELHLLAPRAASGR